MSKVPSHLDLGTACRIWCNVRLYSEKQSPEIWRCVLVNVTVLKLHDALRMLWYSPNTAAVFFRGHQRDSLQQKRAAAFCVRAESFDSWPSVSVMLSAVLSLSCHQLSVCCFSRQQTGYARNSSTCTQSSFVTSPTGIRLSKTFCTGRRKQWK